jgi:hypothetical protein
VDTTSSSCPSSGSILGLERSLKLELVLSNDIRASKSSRFDGAIGKAVRRDDNDDGTVYRVCEGALKLEEGDEVEVDEMEGAFPEEDGGGKKDICDTGIRWMPHSSKVVSSKGNDASASSSEAPEFDWKDGVESSMRGAALSFISWTNSRALEDLSTGIYRYFRMCIESLAHR